MTYTAVNNYNINVRCVDKNEIDSAASKLIDIDKSMLPQTSISPQIWCCKWYNIELTQNNKSSYCYKKGDMVWMNTENLEEFTISNKDYIISIAQNNSILKPLLDQATRKSESNVIDFLMKVVSGKISGNSKNLPLYCFGDISKPIQIRVSTIDDNDTPPTNDNFWRDFFVDTTNSHIIDILTKAFNNILVQKYEDHLKNFHLSGLNTWLANENNGNETSLESRYLLNDFSNIKTYQEYVNDPGMTDNGFDYVLIYRHKFYDDQVCKWFRLWKSGLLEHGGIVTTSTAKKQLIEACGDSLEYDGQCYKVNLAWIFDNAGIETKAPIYKYSINQNEFYTDADQIQFDTDKVYKIQNLATHLDQSTRYSVQVTPMIMSSQPWKKHTSIDNSIWFQSREVNSIQNDSFMFVTGGPSNDFYSYKVQGFVPANYYVF